MNRLLALLLTFTALGSIAHAEAVEVAPVPITDWKAVYGRIEARDRVPARARIGGTVTELKVAEGDMVTEGQTIALVVDDKLDFRLNALDAQRGALSAQLTNAEAELKRGEALLEQGVSTVQRLDSLRTQVEVLRGQIAALDAEAEVVRQNRAEGVIVAPAAGRILDVPLSKGAVVMPGEAVATLATGGIFLRLAVPERHAARLDEGSMIEIESPEGARQGKLVKVYPGIENGRVVADVEVEGLSDRFVDARILVRLPVAERSGLMVPASALVTRAGLDFVQVAGPDGPALRAVVPGQRVTTPEGEMVEILSGLVAGDRIETVPALGAGHE